MEIFNYIWQLAIFVPVILAQTPNNPQTTLAVTECVQGSGITTFKTCNALYSTLAYCEGPSVASGLPTIECYCNQNVFNSFFGCESEERLCLGNGDHDSTFLGLVADWHSGCDAHISFSPTTPALSSITMSNTGTNGFHPDYCTTAFSACGSISLEAGSCSQSYSGQDYTSCMCQPSMISLDYTCEFLGNVSCKSTSAALTNLPLYPACSNLPAVLGTSISGPASFPASTTMASTGTVDLTSSTTTSDSTGTPTITQPVLPNPNPSSSVVSTTSSSIVTLSINYMLLTLALSISLLAVFYLK